MTVGTRAQVFHGNADKTPGGLTKRDLFKGPDGRIKSEKASNAAKQRVENEGPKAMVNAFKPKKGTFKLQPKAGTAAYKKALKKMNK